MLILSWDIQKALSAIHKMIDNEANKSILIEWFGAEHYADLLKSVNGKEGDALWWVQDVCHSKVKAISTLLINIKKKTIDNHLVQRMIDAVNVK